MRYKGKSTIQRAWATPIPGNPYVTWPTSLPARQSAPPSASASVVASLWGDSPKRIGKMFKVEHLMGIEWGSKWFLTTKSLSYEEFWASTNKRLGFHWWEFGSWKKQLNPRRLGQVTLDFFHSKPWGAFLRLVLENIGWFYGKALGPFHQDYPSGKQTYLPSGKLT